MTIKIESLGSREYKEDYNIKYPYVTGGMVHAIASKEMVVKMGNAGMIGYFGTGGLKKNEIEKAILFIQNQLSRNKASGINILPGLMEDDIIDLCLKYKIQNIEAAAYMDITPALVEYRLKGLGTDTKGRIVAKNRIMAKISRPEVARLFLSPAPYHIVNRLIGEKKITQVEATLSKNVPMADDLCIEADSGGHTDGGVASVLIPFMLKLRDSMMQKYQYIKKIRIGAAGGIGTPEAAAASFIMGADFILTGSINQCTVEAQTSDVVKNMLQDMGVQDTDYAPAGDLFETGAQVQVLKKGILFPNRANRLYQLYKYHNSLDDIDQSTKKQLEQRYFKRTFDDIYEECKKYYTPSQIERAERNPKQKMAFVFRWYFGHATRLALQGVEECKVDFQIHCGPALGAFNKWVKNSELEKWQNRHVDEIALKIMQGAVNILNERFQSLSLK